MRDLSPTELACVETAGGFLGALEITPMVNSFKMLTLLGMLDRNAFPGETRIEDLTTEFRRLASRSAALRAETGTAIADEVELRRLIERNPIDAWCGGKGTGGTAYFSYDGAIFRSNVSVPPNCREDLQNLVRELIDWRMAEYLDRDQMHAGDRLICKVIHASGRPIIKLPPRTAHVELPHGWTDLEVDGRRCTANFAKEFINVVRADPASESNVLPDILRRWFGPDAGRPGTRFQVAIEQSSDHRRMEPMGRMANAEIAQAWQYYTREKIPTLFGLTFSPAIWNQGFVKSADHLFLLVKLEKTGLNRDHRYENQFLSPDLFSWQSQNKTRQESKDGQLIRHHGEQGIDVHLFVRRHKVREGKAAPFLYCGPVDFEGWAGDAPISVSWRLRERVPDELQTTLKVPHEND